MSNIYFDYAATTPVDPRVLDKMLPYFNDRYGNPSSVHRYGQQAESAVENARETVAEILHCTPEEIIFTSCGSESDNMALRGAALGMREKHGARQIATSHTEHHAVSKTAEQLEKYYGYTVRWLEPDEYGLINAKTVQDALRPETAVVSVMYANNEIGSINPIAEIGEICRQKNVLLHTDAVQAAAYLPVDVSKLNVDMLSLGGHKFYGPKGIGALYIRKGTPFIPTQTGGGQEGGMRAGTHNVPYIVGFAEALRLANEEREARTAHVKSLRDRLTGTILEEITDVQLTGHPTLRLPQHASFVFKDVDGNWLLTMLDAAGFECSSGSACKTGNPEPSEVVTSLGYAREWGLGSLRITLGMASTAVQVNDFLQVLPGLIEKARALGKK